MNHSIRYINAGEYKVTEPSLFAGFVSGVIAENYDIEQVYLDGFPQLVGLTDAEELKTMFAQLEEIAKRHNVTMTLSVSGTPDNAPEFMKPYILA